VSFSQIAAANSTADFDHLSAPIAGSFYFYRQGVDLPFG